MLAGIRLLTSKYRNDIQPRQLDGIIRERFGMLPSGTKKQDFPRVSLLTIEGQSYYLRLYPIPLLTNAARHLWACNLRRQHKISVPKVQQICFTSVAGHRCLAVLEENLGGKQIGHRTWTISLAQRFAAELAKWHAIREQHYRALPGLFIWFNVATYSKQLNCQHLPGREPTAEQRDLIELGRQLLNEPELFSPLRISHGDVNPHNLIEQNNGGVAWVDMDLISVRPVWDDLAMVICKFMNKQVPTIVDAFEKTYFQHHPDLWEHWKTVRLRWLVLQNVLLGVKWLSIDRRRWGGGNTSAETYRPYEWAQRCFAQAESVSRISQKNHSSDHMIKHIHAAFRQ